MALPDKSALVALDYAYRGAPFCRVEAKALDTTSLDYAYRGAPFVGGADSAQQNNELLQFMRKRGRR